MRVDLMLMVFGAMAMAEEETVIHVTTCQHMEALMGDRAQNCDANHTCTPICKCFPKGMLGPTITLGCTGISMPDLLKVDQSFQNFTLIPALRIWQSEIYKIIEIFFENVRIQHLTIEGSGLGRLGKTRNPRPLRSLGPYLESLDLNSNSIETVSGPFLSDLGRLTHLDLSNNKIKRLESGILDKLHSLQVLSLHNNKIISMAPDLFINLPQLNTLDLRSNDLSLLKSDCFQGLAHIRGTVDLSANRLIHIEDGVFDQMKNLKHLDLSENNLSYLAINGLNSVRSLKLNNNSIHSENAITLGELPELTVIYLDENSIKRLGEKDDLYLSMPKLTTLSATQNEISYINPSHLPEGLQKLYLQYNNIEESPSLGWGPSTLRVLQLGHNSLTGIYASDFSNLRELQVLGLGFNHIESIQGGVFSQNQQLARFYLNHNDLNSLPEILIDSLPSNVVASDMSGNPWHCSCGVKKLAQWLDSEPDLFFNLEQTRCTHGESVRSWAQSSCAPSSTAPWLTGVAILMALASLLMIVAGILLFINNLFAHRGRPNYSNGKGQVWPSRTVNGVRIYDLSHLKRGVPSDMVQLIPPQNHKKVHFDPSIV